jgi:hypothetical protein
MSGVTINSVVEILLHRHRGDNGTLLAIEDSIVPFRIRRVFHVSGVPEGGKRGGHSHLQTKQFVYVVAGVCRFACDDGFRRSEWQLSTGGLALLVPPGIWTEQMYLEEGTVLTVLCDTNFDESDYQRRYQSFLSDKGVTNGPTKTVHALGLAPGRQRNA